MNLNKSSYLKEFIRNNEQKQDKLKTLTDPLATHFGIDVFWNVTIHEDGQLSNTCSYHDATCHFWENDWYQSIDFLVSPKRLESGCFFLDYDNGYHTYVQKTIEKYPLYHPFLIIRKEGSKANLFGFSSKRLTPTLPSLYLNHLPILNSYVDYFLSIDQHSNEKHTIDITYIKGKEAFFGNPYGQASLPKKEKNTPFLKKIGICPHLLKGAEKLTPREKEVLRACLEGKTAIESGSELKLSPRTVQSYIENVKNRLGIITREELLEMGKILKAAGFLK